MEQISAIDPNFQGQAAPQALQWLPVTAKTPQLYGLLEDEDGGFCRLPRAVAETVSPQVRALYANTAGGRLRFVTDSRTVAVRVALRRAYGASHVAYLGTAGLDAYEKTPAGWRYAGSFLPPDPAAHRYTAALPPLPSPRRRELLLHFPLYAEVAALSLGLDEGAVFAAAPPYSNPKRVVFYGSSITQGACSPRPGVSYPAILSRRLDFDFCNLGFSDGARAEPAMLAYLCRLPMDILVCDYDHNAPTAAFLRDTHRAMYEAVRAARPALPILLASAPVAHPDAQWAARRQIILETYRYAKARGDAQVAFVDGAAMFPPDCREECTVDGAHPNALGMYHMACAFARALRRFL